MVAPHPAFHLESTAALAGLEGSDAIPVNPVSGPPPATLLPTSAAQTVMVRPGDTLASLAATFHGDAGTLRWANSIVEGTDVVPGTAILIPPGPGALIRVNHDEAPSAFAARLGLATQVVLDYNLLPVDSPRPDGTYLQIPIAAAPAGALASSSVEPITPGVPAVAAGQYWNDPNSSSSQLFPQGQCTWYVATRRRVPWTGNAGDWFHNARQYGRPEGRTPVAGAIAVIANSGVGHVAYVERVNTDGSFVISEEHYPVLGVRDQRTVTVKTLDLIGFIY